MDLENIENALKLINKTVIENYAVAVKIPSCETTPINIKPLSIFQQKQLIALSAEKEIYNSKFNEIFFNILKSNYLSEDLLPVTSLTILDKQFIAIALRSNINNVFVGAENTNINLNLLQESLYKSYVDNADFIKNTHTFNYEKINIKCIIPTIETELMCDISKSLVKTEDIADQLQNIIAETVTNEIVKYVDTVSIDTEIIPVNKFKFAQRKQIVEQLPAAVLEKILTHILTYKQIIETALTYKTADTNNTLQINGTFFATA